MGKSKKQPDALRPKASRVEKSRHELRNKSKKRPLPKWYYRITSKFPHPHGKSPNWRDFEEDLSELEDVECSCEEYECEDEDCKCFCHEDHASTRSYDGPDADWYYELKEKRDEVKRCKLDEKRADEEGRQKNRPVAQAKQDEVKAAYRSFKKATKRGEITLLDLSTSTCFDLFSVDHVEHCYLDPYGRKRLDIDWIEPHTMTCLRTCKSCPETRLLHLQIYLDGCTCIGLDECDLPEKASLTPVKLKCQEGSDISIVFISNKYIKLKIPRETVFSGYDHKTAAEIQAAPKVFKFVGIRHVKSEKELRIQEIVKNLR